MTFAGGNLVATNRSCQEILSQNADTTNSFEEPMEKERLQLSGGKLWTDQIEEDSEEGEISYAMEADDESTDEEVEEAEQNVNGKAKESTGTKANQSGEDTIMLQNPLPFPNYNLKTGMKDLIQEANKDRSTNNSLLKIADAVEQDAAIPIAGEQNGSAIDSGVRSDNKGNSSVQVTVQQCETNPKEHTSGIKINKEMQNTEQLQENFRPSGDEHDVVLLKQNAATPEDFQVVSRGKK